MKLPIITTLVIALCFLTITIAEAKIYTWTDDSGEKHYSATPPKSAERISNLKDDLRIVDNKFAATKVPKKTESLIKKAKPERINGSDNKSEVKRSNKRNFCRSQRGNLSMLKKNHKINWVKSGKNKTLNNKQRKDKILILEENIRMNCSFSGERRDRKPVTRKKQQKRQDD